MSSNPVISAFIIAGGKSKRFGQDKSMYLFEDKPLIRHVFDALAPVFPKISIIADDTDKYNFPDVKAYPDIIPALGPIGGIYTALHYADKGKIFICACDMPFLNSDFIEYMISVSHNCHITVPVVNNYYEPLHTVYSADCLELIKKIIDSGDRKVISLFDMIEVRKVSEEEISYYDDPFKMFRNINYMEDI